MSNVVASGSSLCAIGRSGERLDDVKYLEGRSAALREVRRKLGDTAGDEAHREVEQRWRDHLQLALDRNIDGPPRPTSQPPDRLLVGRQRPGRLATWTTSSC